MAMDIGTAIRDRRKAWGWTQARLSDELGVTKQAVSAMERVGYSPSVKTLVKVSRALGMPAWLLLKEAGA